MPLHVAVDAMVCKGFGNCVMAAPEVFDLDPATNVAHVLPGRPTDADAGAIEEAESGCPVRAISTNSP